MATNGSAEVDLYEILGISKTATKAEIKKAYHKAALSSHPDKVPEHEREEAHIKFKAVSEAYEILFDEDKRQVYDTHGMAAFEAGARGPGGMDGEINIDDILSQMFGMGGMGGMGGDPFGGSGGGRPKRPRRGRDEEQEYKVTLEELYKGKTVKFGATKNVICSHCKGSGGKEKTKPKTCERCHGGGFVMGIRQVGPMMTQERVTCDHCQGFGELYKEKDKCRKCKGKRTVSEKKALELYIPRGAMQGERIILEGEADQVPDQIPGDIVFTLVEEDHDVFQRAGYDLLADLHITLAEALCGFSRAVLTHLDGRGIHINVPRGKVLNPGQTIKVVGEGMPKMKSDVKGDLYLNVQIEFPKDNWMADEASFASLQKILPASDSPKIESTHIDEVEFTEDADLKEFGANSGDPRAGDQWEDDDDEEGMGGGAQCAPQ